MATVLVLSGVHMLEKIHKCTDNIISTPNPVHLDCGSSP